jgi:hypothetical protein
MIAATDHAAQQNFRTVQNAARTALFYLRASFSLRAQNGNSAVRSHSRGAKTPVSAMDLSFLLALVVFLGGIWVYLYKVILDLTVTEPDAPTLLSLGITHYVVFLYLAVSLVILYAAGISAAKPPPPSPWLSLAQTILFNTWPITILVLLLSLLSANVGPESAFKWVFIFFSVAALVSFFLLIWSGKTSPSNSVSWGGQMGVFLMSIPIAATFYLMLMSEFLADVQIKTDKQFYEAADTILVSVRAGGYIFRPHLFSISCGIFEQHISSDVTLAIPPEQRGHTGGVLWVTFRSEIVSLTRKRYHLLNIVEA